MTKTKEKINKIILFVNDDEQETRYITAKFLDNELVINFSNFNHTVKYVVDYRYKFNKKETNKFTKLLAKNKSDFLYKLKERFNTSSACADLTKYATDNNIDYDFIYGHEGENLYRYEIGDVFLDEDLLYDKNKNVIIPSFYTHPKNGIMELYLPNGNLFMSISYKNNKKNGFTKCYSKKNQKLLWEQNYTNDKLDGITKKYYSDGSLEREETFIMGIKEGVDKYYDADGYLEQEEMWAKNQRNGFARKYYTNGQVKHEAFFKNDLQDGNTKEYYESGKLEYEGEFKNDSAIGWGIRYYENGNIMWKSPHGKTKGEEIKYYDNGNIEFRIESIGEKRNGKFTDYFKDGKIRGIGNYKDDERHGICKYFYRNGNLQEEVPYKKGKVTGIGKSYYSNGNIHHICEYKNGKRNGYSVCYDKKGNIMQKVLYKNGLVVDFNDNDGIKGILGLDKTETKESKKTKSDVLVSNDGIEKNKRIVKNPILNLK